MLQSVSITIWTRLYRSKKIDCHAHYLLIRLRRQRRAQRIVSEPHRNGTNPRDIQRR